jgi:threonine/homoserine/homoserine lactone efflux protein
MLDPIAYGTYSFVMSITPGPNNLMLTASGARFGFRRTIPHLLGIAAGLAIQLLAVCAGLGALFARWPAAQEVLRWAGAGYLIYLGWHLLGGTPAGRRTVERPVRFLEAAAFQFLNPKAWVMSLTAASLFLPPELGARAAVAYVVGLMALVNLPCVAVWALFGSALRELLAGRVARLIFNAAMAVALAGTGVMMVLSRGMAPLPSFSTPVQVSACSSSPDTRRSHWLIRSSSD